jgi:glycosyltransferase involved in cell wall biosynthesis
VGRLAPEKDQASFLRIVHFLRRDLPSLHAVLVGDGDLRFQLQSIAADLGLGSYVHFVGERKESRKFISGLDLFILTSKAEGFSNALLEAAFLGVPCLSTSVGAAREVLNDPDSLFPSGDTEIGYRKAKDYLINRKAALARAHRLQGWVTQNFSSQTMASHWLSLYEGERAPGGYPCETRSDPVALLP